MANRKDTPIIRRTQTVDMGDASGLTNKDYLGYYDNDQALNEMDEIYRQEEMLRKLEEGRATYPRQSGGPGMNRPRLETVNMGESPLGPEDMRFGYEQMAGPRQALSQADSGLGWAERMAIKGEGLVGRGAQKVAEIAGKIPGSKLAEQALRAGARTLPGRMIGGAARLLGGPSSGLPGVSCPGLFLHLQGLC